MPDFVQTNRLLQITTPLGANKLLATGFHGSEGISQLFSFNAECLADNKTDVDFSKLMGQSITVALRMADEKTFRYFNGICVCSSQGESDQEFASYQLEIVPKFWLLTKRTQSRIFQHITVPDILKKVLVGFPVKFELTGTYEPRDYCVQYRESDYNFASRLMEEEGIFYFFLHENGVHTMVVADSQDSFRDMPFKNEVTYKNLQQGNPQKEDFIYKMNKSQQLTSGKVTLWDHHFEKPHSTLEAFKDIVETVTLGKKAFKLKVADNSALEVYDYPGEYAQRFDGIDKGGGEQPAEVAKIDKDNIRTTSLRMQQIAAQALMVQGTSSCRQFVSGHKFKVKHLDTDPTTSHLAIDGQYVITSIQHHVVAQVNYRSGTNQPFSYSNQIESIPGALIYRPERSTPKPVVPGTQTAVVVGVAGQEIYTDKYGRIKVQFHWDQHNKYNENSSCWVRVGHLSAGRHWGMLSIPRIGQEVIIDFVEGDPDQPLCIGVVYNAAQMPMYKLPDHKTKSYLRTNSTLGGSGYNEFRFEDLAGSEQIYIHAQKDMDERVRNDSKERVGNDRHMRVGFYLVDDYKGGTTAETKKGSQFEEVAVNKHLKVHKNLDEHIGGDQKLLVGGIDGPGRVDIHIKDRKLELIDKESDLHVKKDVRILYDENFDWHVKKAVKQLFDSTFDEHIKGAVKQTFDAAYDLNVKGKKTEKVAGVFDLDAGGDSNTKVGGTTSHQSGKDYQQKVAQKYALDSGQEVHIKGGMNVVIEAGMKLTLKGPGGFISIDPAGVAIQGTMVLINSGGAAGSGSGASPASPATAATAANAVDAQDAVDAKPIKPADADKSSTGEASNISAR